MKTVIVVFSPRGPTERQRQRGQSPRGQPQAFVPPVTGTRSGACHTFLLDEVVRRIRVLHRQLPVGDAAVPLRTSAGTYRQAHVQAPRDPARVRGPGSLRRERWPFVPVALHDPAPRP
jgi:hypothetical protein